MMCSRHEIKDPSAAWARVADAATVSGAGSKWNNSENLFVGYHGDGTLDVDVEGETWRVELAPPSRTTAAGFTEEVAAVGDEVTAIGNRSRESTEPRMKAVRIVVRGETYDVYPYRVPS